MPITNRPYGVWKILQWLDPDLNMATARRFVVKSANVGSQQESKVEKFIQGTALPVIMTIGGATATMKIEAPLLVVGPIGNTTVGYGPARSVGDNIHDGFDMWNIIRGSTGAASMFSSTYEKETGFILEELTFKVDAQNGAVYTFGLKGDADYLGEERNDTSGAGMSLVDGSSVWSSGNLPFPIDTPLRVAAFYDITAAVGNMTGWVENFQITYKFTTTGFNYVGQNTQRQIMGIGGAEVSFQGTMISSTGEGLREPVGYQFPWQAMNANNDTSATDAGHSRPRTAAGYETYGGIVHVNTQFDIAVRLRDGTGTSSIDILPGVSVGKNIIQQSSVQYSADLIRTQFQGLAWITDPSQLITGT